MSDAEDPIKRSDLPTRFVAGVAMIAVALVAQRDRLALELRRQG